MPDQLVESRRRFLSRAGAAGIAAFNSSIVSAKPKRRAARIIPSAETPIEHVIVAAEENRSFDHYFGYSPAALDQGFGVPNGWTQPDGDGGVVSPFHLRSVISADPGHSWGDTHAEWNGGAMDGFYTTNGKVALGYYTAEDLPYYYELADRFTLCANYFCSVLGPTLPNRLYLCSGTSGGNTSNDMPRGSLTYPMILDLFAQHDISWKNYRTGFGAELGVDDAMQFFTNWRRDPRLFHGPADFLADLRTGALPQVAFLSPGLLNNEHAPLPITWGIATMRSLITAVMNSPLWSKTALILTYDEAGGFFDHVPPPVFDAYGAGIRVPAFIISPYAKAGHLEATQYEHASVLKFIERVFGLPTLASINHEFDVQTPATNNEAAAPGATFGPPAPPRDGREDVGDLMECFDFG